MKPSRVYYWAVEHAPGHWHQHVTLSLDESVLPYLSKDGTRRVIGPAESAGELARMAKGEVAARQRQEGAPHE